MRTLTFAIALGLAYAAAAPVALAQVTEAERAAARELFRLGDELQHKGQLAPALDKFQRAQAVFPAPTNLLRIAQCQAGLGKLVEATESYRAVVRTQLPAGSPPAFQTAIDQAKNELPQVEPLVPKLTIDVTPPGIGGAALQIDGQGVPAALIGTPIPLDPGQHAIVVSAAGFAGAQQSVALQEREARTVSIVLRAIPPPPPAVVAPPPPAPPQATVAVAVAPAPQPAGVYVAPAVYTAPPPPPAPDRVVAPPKSRTGLLVGLHIGDGLFVPSGGGTNSSGLAYALDGGLRFGRNWFIHATFEHGDVNTSDNTVKANTTTAGVHISVITDPDKVSFYASLGAQERWLTVTAPVSASPSGGEGVLGLGLWIPLGHTIRLLPQVTGSFGTFSGDDKGHQVYVFSLGGYYNLDFDAHGQ
jgi:hypothetical protein